MTQHLNYCRQLLSKTMLEEDDPSTAADLRRSVKFLLPEGGVSIDDFELRALGDDVLRLPFERIALEFPVGVHPERGKMVRAIVLCVALPEGIRVTPIAGIAGEDWKVQNSFTMPNRDWCDKSGEPWQIRVPEKVRGIALWVLLFLNALACSNVHIERTAESKTRKAMMKKGALPFDEYHVLTIDVAAKAGAGSSGSASHRSPREHLRRGHIRRLADGRRIWVNAAVINAGVGGKVTKDYALR